MQGLLLYAILGTAGSGAATAALFAPKGERGSTALFEAVAGVGAVVLEQILGVNRRLGDVLYPQPVGNYPAVPIPSLLGGAVVGVYCRRS